MTDDITEPSSERDVESIITFAKPLRRTPLCRRGLILVFGIVLVNMLPMLGVIFSDWNLYEVMTLYWGENLIIGAFTVLKLLYVSGETIEDDMAMMASAPAFLVYFLLCFGQAVLIHTLFQEAPSESSFEGLPVEWFAFGGLFFTAFVRLKWMTLMMALNQGLSFVYGYVMEGICHPATIKQIIFFPLSRLVIMQTIIITAGAGLKKIGLPPVLFIGLIFLKMAMEVGFDLIEQRTLADDE